MIDLRNKNINIVFDGNSLTAGVGANNSQDFPTVIYRWFLQNSKSTTFLSYGVGGQNLQTMVTNAPTKTLNKVVAGKINILVLNEDANGLLDNYTSDQNVTLMNQYIKLAYEAGYDYVITWNSSYPRLPYDLFTPSTLQLDRQHEYFEKANTGFLNSDINVDMRLNAKIGGARNQNQDKKYFNDYIHFTEYGYFEIADEIINKAFLKIFR